jgi:hypothetical protein
MVLSNFTTRMLIGLAVLACCSPREARSQAANPPAASPAPVPAVPPEISVSDYFDNWFTRANQAQAEQPHWMTPLVTVTPRLEEEVRYDQYWESRGNGSTLDIFDSGKGLELIPTETNEVQGQHRAPGQGLGRRPVSRRQAAAAERQ